VLQLIVLNVKFYVLLQAAKERQEVSIDASRIPNDYKKL